MPARTNEKCAVGRSKVSVQRKKTRPVRCVKSYERVAQERGFAHVAGVDEVGRGCLFGPVFAAAVILNPERPIRGLRDSKVLDGEARAELCSLIMERSICWAIAGADAFEIDQMNILQASRLAMRRAVEALAVCPDYLLVDAVSIDLPISQLALINGDARCRAIAAASIVAKVHRDACLKRWHEVFPHYNLASNKGYSTPDHRRALREHGPTSMHRFSFEPVRGSTDKIHWDGYLAGSTGTQPDQNLSNVLRAMRSEKQVD